MTSSRERTRTYRERQKLAGYRSLEIIVTGNTYEALMKLRANGASWEYIMKRTTVKPECSEALCPLFKDLSWMAARHPAFKRLMRAHGLSQATV